LLDKKIINNNKAKNNKSISPEKIKSTKKRNLSPSQKNKINYIKNLSSETKRRQEIRKNEINKSRENLATKLNKK